MIKRFSPFTRAPALFGPPAETPVQSFGFGPAPQSRSPWAAADKGMQSGLSMSAAEDERTLSDFVRVALTQYLLMYDHVRSVRGRRDDDK